MKKQRARSGDEVEVEGDESWATDFHGILRAQMRVTTGDVWILRNER